MYAARRMRDRRALELLERVVSERGERYEASRELVGGIGYDGWDVLEGRKVVIPRSFVRSGERGDWYARNYWVNEVSWVGCVRRRGRLISLIVDLECLNAARRYCAGYRIVKRIGYEP